MPAFTFELVIVLLPIVLNGAFAMSEMAIVSARKPRLEHRAESGDRRARIALNLANDPNQLLSTIQVGITLIGIINGAYGGTSLAAPVAMADGGRRHLRLCPACHQTCYLPLVAEVSGRGRAGISRTRHAACPCR